MDAHHGKIKNCVCVRISDCFKVWATTTKKQYYYPEAGLAKVVPLVRDEACHEVLPTPSFASEAFGVVGSLPRSDRRRGYRFIAPVAFHRDLGLVAAGAQLASLVRKEGLAVHGQLLPAERAQKVLRVP